MKILALELSSDCRSAALLDAKPEEASLRHRSESIPAPAGSPFEGFRLCGTARRHGKCSTQTFEMIGEAFANAAWDRQVVEVLAVGLGPGSYTGVRIAIATAQGWQIARGVKLVGVSSAEALAWEAARKGITGEIKVAIDAQRQEFYLARYQVGPSSVERREPLHVVKRAEVGRCIEQGERVVGPNLTSIFPDGHDLYPQADIIASIAADRGEFRSGEALEPIYLRKTDFVKAPKPRVIPG